MLSRCEIFHMAADEGCTGGETAVSTANIIPENGATCIHVALIQC